VRKKPVSNKFFSIGIKSHIEYFKKEKLVNQFSGSCVHELKIYYWYFILLLLENILWYMHDKLKIYWDQD